MSTNFYGARNNVAAKVAGGGYTAGAGTITVDDGSKFLYTDGSTPSSTKPIVVSTFLADGTPKGVYRCEAKSGNVLTLTSLLSGTDSNLAVGNLVEMRWCAEHDAQLATAINTNETAIVALQADDAATVHLTGTETISGAKTFSTVPTLGSLSGLIKTATGAISVAVAGTDYLDPTHGVTLTVPGVIFTSPVSGTGTNALALTLITQTASTVLAGPTSGGAATPTFRALVAADIPTLAHSSFSGLTSGDDHTQYTLLAGRAGGQTLNLGTTSGQAGRIDSTAHATKGQLNFNGTSTYVAATSRLRVQSDASENWSTSGFKKGMDLAYNQTFLFTRDGTGTFSYGLINSSAGFAINSSTADDGSAVRNELFLCDINNDVFFGLTARYVRIRSAGLWHLVSGSSPNYVIGDTTAGGDYGQIQWDSSAKYLKILATGATRPAAVFRPAATPSADIVQIQKSDATIYTAFDKLGRPYTGTAAGAALPSVSAGAGAGTSPTVSVAGSDVNGVITVTTGTTPSASAVVATLTFSAAYAAAPKAVLVLPANAAAAALSGTGQVYADTANVSTTKFDLSVGSAALAASTTYKWFYLVFG